MDAVDEFNTYREKMNDKIMAQDNLVIKRLFNLDTNAYKPGALDGNQRINGFGCFYGFAL